MASSCGYSEMRSPIACARCSVAFVPRNTRAKYCAPCKPMADQERRNETKRVIRRSVGRCGYRHDAHVKAWAIDLTKRQREASKIGPPAPTHTSIGASAFARWRMRNDPSYVIHQRMRVAIRKALKGSKGGRRWEQIVGYDLATLTEHIRRQLPKGYSMADLFGGALHIDHIVPKSTFDVTRPDELRACWALSNLRPLTASENRRKHDTRTHIL